MGDAASFKIHLANSFELRAENSKAGIPPLLHHLSFSKLHKKIVGSVLVASGRGLIR